MNFAKHYIAILFFISVSYCKISAQVFDFIVDDAQGCAPHAVTFSNITDESYRNDYQYEWIVGPGQFSTQTNTVQYTYVNSGAYTVTMRVKNSQNQIIETITKSDFITVFRDPYVTVTANKGKTCMYKPIQFSVDEVDSEAPIVSWQWVMSDGISYSGQTIPAHSFLSPGNYTAFVTVVDQNGCTNRLRHEVAVEVFDDFPQTNFSANNLNLCESTATIVFTNNTTPETDITYNWSFGDGGSSTQKNPSHTFNDYGNYFVTLVATSPNECDASAFQRVRLIDYQVSIAAQDQYKILDGANKACDGSVFLQANIQTSSPDLASTYQWQVNGVDAGEFISTSLAAQYGDTYTVSLTASNGICTETVTQIIEVEPEQQASVEVNNTFFCETPGTPQYTVNNAFPGSTFEWIIDNIMYTGNPIIGNYTREGIFNNASLQITSPNQCIQTITIDNPIEVADHLLTIVIDKQNSGCIPYELTFEETFIYSAIDKDPIETVLWDFDNGDSAYVLGPVSTIYTDKGRHLPRLTITTEHGCEFSEVYTPYIFTGDIPSITFDVPDSVCTITQMPIGIIKDDPSGYNTIYDTLFVFFPPSNLAQGLVPVDDTFEQQFRDTIGPHEIHYFISDHGCGIHSIDSTNGERTIINVKGPIVGIASTPPDCNNPYDYSYSISGMINLDTLNPNQYFEWFISRKVGELEFNRKRIGKNIPGFSIDYSADTLGIGDYVITLVAYNCNEECIDDICFDCSGTDCIDKPLSNLICVDSTKITTRVRDIDISGAYSLAYSTPCLGDSAVFIRNTPWDYLDGHYNVFIDYWRYTHDSVFMHRINMSSDTIFYFFNSLDITQVEVVAHNIHGCWDTTFIPVKVYQPQANFIADVVSDCLPFVSEFSDITASDTTIVARTWTFGNGQTAHNDSVVQTQYTQEGLRSPSLHVVDILGCESTYTAPNYIRPVVPNSRFAVINPFVCMNHPARFVRNTNDPNLDNNIHRLLWDFGDGNTDEVSLADTVSHIYTIESSPTDFNITFTAYSMSPEGNECVSSTTGTVQVKDANSKIIFNSMDECKEQNQRFVVYLQSSWYNDANRYNTVKWWKIDNNDSIFISQRKNLSVIFFDNYGEQELYLSTQSKYYGCETDTMSITIDVPGYTANIVANKTQVCVGEEITFSLVNQQNLERYVHYFEFGDGTRLYNDTDVVSHAFESLPDNPQNVYTVQFVVNAPGCIAQQITQDIQVLPIMANFLRGEFDTDSIGCAPYTVSFVNTSLGMSGNNFVWDFDDGTSSTQTNPTHTFSNINDTYSVSLSITTSACSHTMTKNIHTYPTADISYIVDTLKCYGTTIPIQAIGDFTDIQWTPSQYFAHPTAPSTQLTLPYSMYVHAGLISPNQCQSMDSVFIFVQQEPFYLGAPDSLLLYYFSVDSLRFTSESSDVLIAGEQYNVNNIYIPGTIYSWTPSHYLSCDDCPSPDIDLRCGALPFPSCIDFPEHVDYTIRMTDYLGCFDKDTTIRFSIIIESKAALPQAFSPNGDGFNDIAYVRGWGIKEFLEVRIYNRWGQQVFLSTNLNKGWDGTFKGEPQNSDTYSYTIKYINTRDEEEFVKGYITLLR